MFSPHLHHRPHRAFRLALAIVSLAMVQCAAAGQSSATRPGDGADNPDVDQYRIHWQSSRPIGDAAIWHTAVDRIGAIAVGPETIVIGGYDANGGKGRSLGLSKETGKILWSITHKHIPAWVHDRYPVIVSTPFIDGDRLYYFSNRGELCCVLPANGKVVWMLDMPLTLGVYKKDTNDTLELGPSPIVVGDIVYCITANGRDDGFRKVQAPDAPSFVAVDKWTGKVIWTSNAPGRNIEDGQWSTPAPATVDGAPEILFPGGDGALYAFEPRSGKQLWKLDCRNQLDSKDYVRDFIIAPPLVVGQTAYVSLALDWERAHVGRRLLAIDLHTHEIRWAVSPRGFTGALGPMAFSNGTLYAVGNQGLVVAVDGQSGKERWTRQLESGVYGGICFHNENLYLTTEDGDLMILSSSAGKTLDLCNLDNPGVGTPIVDGKRVFVVTRSSAWLIGLPE